jgi:hypothetical protein
VSREAAEASAAALKQLLERRFDEVELLIIHIGMHFGDHCVLAQWAWMSRATSMCWREGATENAEAANDLLQQHLVAHGVDPSRGVYSSSTARRLCAQRSRVWGRFGADTPMQR